MTYLDLAGKAIRRHVPDDVLPDGDTDLLFRLYALLMLAKGDAVTTTDVHNAWSVWMQASDPEHESIRPFEELDLERQTADEPYVKAIKMASRTRDWESH
jgi:hypothetical protein